MTRRKKYLEEGGISLWEGISTPLGGISTPVGGDISPLSILFSWSRGWISPSVNFFYLKCVDMFSSLEKIS